MQAVVFHGERRIELADLPDPTPGAGEVVIAVDGLRHVRVGPAHLPRSTPSAADDRRPRAGRRRRRGRSSGVPHDAGSAAASWCTTTSAAAGATSAGSGWTQMCREGATAMGATAPGCARRLRQACPSSAVLPMPEGLSDLAAAAISCGTGTAWGALKRLELSGRRHGRDLRPGPGRPGGHAARSRHGCPRHRPGHLAVAARPLRRLRRVGDRSNPAEVDSVADAIRDLNGGRGVSKSLETSGASSAAEAALHVLDLWGVGLLGRRRLHHPLRPDRAPVQADHRASRRGPCRSRRWRTAPTSWSSGASTSTRCSPTDGSSTTRSQAYELFDKQSSGKGVFIP